MLISTLIGLGTSLLPKIINGGMEQMQDRADKRFELQMMELQGQQADKQHTANMEVAAMSAAAQANIANYENFSSNLKNSSQWVNNICALVRPLVTYYIVIAMTIFAFIAYAKGNAEDPLQLLMALGLHDALGLVLGFWYGSRENKK